MAEYARYLGIDQHKDTLVIAMACAGRDPAYVLGRVRNREEDIARWLNRQRRQWGTLDDMLCCYEAGPCGYGLHRQMGRMGVACEVIAPSLTPRKPGERVRTDKRDATKLAILLRGGELTPIWVPDAQHEALRDLVRAREAAQEDLLRQRHRLSKFLLRQSQFPPGGVRPWTRGYEDWLNKLEMRHGAHRVLLPELRQAILTAKQRVSRLDTAIEEVVAQSPWYPVIQALQCFRGIQLLTAVTLVVELGAVARFARPRQLMAYAGLVPMENSSGQTVRRGPTTGAGNTHLRRIVIEAAWHYRHRPGIGRVLERRQRGQPAEVIDIAWRAQLRLHKRYRILMGRGKEKNKVITALARELLAFIWEAMQVLPTPDVTEAAV
jgi:transposase